MNTFSEDSNLEEGDKYLKENYGFGMNWFHSRLSAASTFYNLRSAKKNLSKYRQKLRYLESFRERILKQLEVMTSKSGIIRDIEMKRKYRKPGLTEQQRHEEIIKLFNLDPIFKRTDKKISQTKRQILMLETFPMKTIDRRKSIQPLTMVALVWLIAMKKARKQRRYRDVVALLKWFSKNYRDELMKNFGRLLYVSESAVRRAYERYIEGPSQEQETYRELIYEFFDSSFDNDF